MKLIIHNVYFDYMGKRYWFNRYLDAKLKLSLFYIRDNLRIDELPIINHTKTYILQQFPIEQLRGEA